MTISLDRRSFIAGAAAALVIPMALPKSVRAATRAASGPADAATASATPLTSYLRISEDGTVTIMAPFSEMGQGTHTGYAAIIADELGVDIAQIRLTVPEQPAPEYRLPFGQMRSVGSFGIRAWVKPLRKAAAQARTVLVQAGANRWGIDASKVLLGEGRVQEIDGTRSLAIADLISEAAALPLPEEPKLRPADSRRFVGNAVRRIDTPEKTDGSAIYGIDVKRPDMLYGAVRLSPVFGAEVASIDPASVDGAVAVAEVPHGAVVIAESWPTAKQLADRLTISWKPTPHDQISSADLWQTMRDGLSVETAPAAVAKGDAVARISASERVVTADYEAPFLAHVAMEPITATAQLTDTRCDVWMSTQGHDVVMTELTKATGLPAKDIYIHTTYLGGGFGRKTHGEIAVQAALASRAVGGRPVNVIWSREDDVQQGQYRPAMAARLSAALGDDGQIEAMHVRLSGPMMGTEYAHVTVRNNFDFFSHAVVGKNAYMGEHYRLDHHVVDVPPSTCPWRAVSSSQNGFFVEAFIDELAHAAGMDPMAYRKARLAGSASHIACLESVERRSGWGSPLPGPNWGRGVAIVESYGSRVAQVAEVEMEGDVPRVRRVWVAIDCGEAINPGQVETQMVGSVIDALGPALRCHITIENGRAVQSNFDSYPILRMSEVPEIDVEIVATGAEIGGVGEPGVPPVAPAVANAIFAATGRRRRRMPLEQV